MSCKILVFTKCTGHRAKQSAASSNELLRELFLLLEEYAPSWYSEELHDRAVAALQARL